MAKFGISCTLIYNGYVEVEAENEEEAIAKAELNFTYDKTTKIPDELYAGNVAFGFGEMTADYADEIE